ncbi:hypothetical protein SPFM1_00267 [Salmonella phage SPFM1]|nr:hypothetical protein SPFM1_00267 [Salmonella phage SPFM1]
MQYPTDMTVKNLLSYCTTIDFDTMMGVDLAETRYILSQHVYADAFTTDDLHLDFMSEAAVLARKAARLYPQVPTPSTMAYRPGQVGKSLEMSSRHIKLSWPYWGVLLNSDQVWKLRGRYYVTFDDASNSGG